MTKKGVPSWDLQSKTEQYEKYIKNPSRADLASGLYYPRLTGYRRNRFSEDNNVRIEFSVPKLLYLNNLDEVSDCDFDLVVETLQARLKTMGLMVLRRVIEEAHVSAVHYSKNIQLEDGYTSSHLISEMNKVNLRKSFDFSRSRYINDGQSLTAHTTTHQLVIYDKIADLNKDKKRAIDKEQTNYQTSLFAPIREAAIEVIRFEVRLSNRQKMKSLLSKLGYSANPTFQDVFKTEISKQVVSEYWNALIKERNLGLFALSTSTKDVLRNVIGLGKLKPRQAIYLVGLYLLARDEGGMRELRSIVEKAASQRTWYRITEDVKDVYDVILKGSTTRGWVAQIDTKLGEYKPYKQSTDLSTKKIEL